MTDIQVGTNKTANRENKKNSINRPKGTQSNEKTPKRFESYEGKPIE